MASSLRERISSLASRFADEILAVVSQSVDERLAHGGAVAPSFGRKVGRVARRSADALAEVGERIVAALAREPRGIRSEDLRAAVGLTRAEMFRPIGMLLAAGRIRKTGQKRRTVYFAEAGAGASPSVKPARSSKKRSAGPRKATGKAAANGKRAGRARGKGSASPAAPPPAGAATQS
jgi:hypothetical protein